MSRYQPLADFLAGKKDREWDASFADVERCLGFPLPKSAYKYPAWWANQAGAGHSQTRGWRSVGWRTCAVDVAAERVRFERDSASALASAVREARFPYVAQGRESLLARASELTGISDPDLLVDEGLRALVAREAGARLARLGGTMPDLDVPPRKRPGF
jgi:hypothetical protein